MARSSFSTSGSTGEDRLIFCLPWTPAVRHALSSLAHRLVRKAEDARGASAPPRTVFFFGRNHKRETPPSGEVACETVQEYTPIAAQRRARRSRKRPCARATDERKHRLHQPRHGRGAAWCRTDSR
jgi:hypothetical protein